MFGYPDEIAVRLGIERDQALAQRMDVRCRKCPECLKHRARLWTARAIDETKLSRRTWFGTLTIREDRQLQAHYWALRKFERGGWAHNEVTPEMVFRESASFLGKEITLFLKRVRKVAPIRYLLVTEAHKSGRPHFHILIHEYEGKVSKRSLEDKWRYGFSHWRLIDTGQESACGYAAKYLAKSALTRVRASEEYGQGINALATEQLLAATRDVVEHIRSRKSEKPVEKDLS